MIPAEQLVPGDIVLLESGDKIPADLRLVEAKNLRTEEAALTGESVPADKIDRPGLGQGDGRRPRVHGLFRHAWSCPAARPASSSRRAARPNSGASTRCSPDVSPLETPLLRQIKKFGYAITVDHSDRQRADLRLWATGSDT